LPIKPSKAIVLDELEQEEEEAAPPKYDFEAMLEQALKSEGGATKLIKQKEAPKKAKTARTA
jgi:hypothetical protein